MELYGSVGKPQILSTDYILNCLNFTPRLMLGCFHIDLAIVKNLILQTAENRYPMVTEFNNHPVDIYTFSE